MEPSPAGHEICVVFGNARGIIDRGRQIEDLGGQMIGAAGVLRAIADNGVAQKGLSIDKIKEVIGEIDEELKLAGERYAPSGSALVTYGNVLDRVQDQMRLIVPRCQSAWDDYEDARSAYRGVNHPLPTDHQAPAPETQGPSQAELDHQQDIGDARRRMNDAYDDFIAEAGRFDGQYETWENAFDAAANGIDEATSGGIKDGFWDNVDGAVDLALTILTWAGVFFAVLAFVIGGPIIALIGAAIAIASLALTIYQVTRGDAGGWDLALAIVGVIPFGSLAKFSRRILQGGHRAPRGVHRGSRHVGRPRDAPHGLHDLPRRLRDEPRVRCGPRHRVRRGDARQLRVVGPRSPPHGHGRRG